VAQAEGSATDASSPSSRLDEEHLRAVPLVGDEMFESLQVRDVPEQKSAIALPVKTLRKRNEGRARRHVQPNFVVHRPHKIDAGLDRVVAAQPTAYR
jgi:hypothetical protein